MVSLALAFTALALAAVEQPNVKLDLEAAEASARISEEGYPKGIFDGIWVPKDSKSGLLAAGVPRQFRHMHFMVASAFYDQRSDRRRIARQWLEEYRCENILACRDYFSFLDGAIKANALKLKKADKKRAEKIRDSLRLHLKTLDIQLPPRTGVCSPQAQRNHWLELEYGRYCPPYRIQASGSMCGRLSEFPDSCTATKLLQKKLDWDSNQAPMSSTFLERVVHAGPSDCSGPWETTIQCGGVGRVEFKLKCEAEPGSFPVRVSCAEVKK